MRRALALGLVLLVAGCGAEDATHSGKTPAGWKRHSAGPVSFATPPGWSVEAAGGNAEAVPSRADRDVAQPGITIITGPKRAGSFDDQQREIQEVSEATTFNGRNLDRKTEEVSIEGAEDAVRKVLVFDGNGGRRYRATTLAARTEGGQDVQITVGDFAEGGKFDVDAALDAMRISPR